MRRNLRNLTKLINLFADLLLVCLRDIRNVVDCTVILDIFRVYSNEYSLTMYRLLYFDNFHDVFRLEDESVLCDWVSVHCVRSYLL